MRCRTCSGKLDVPHDEWKCNYCATRICVNCYIKHTGAKHPEMYALKRLNEEEKGRTESVPT